MRKILAALIFGIGMGFSISAGVSASEGGETLRIGTNHWSFWRRVKDGVPSGADLDIWSEMAKRAGLACEFEVMTHQDYLAGLASGSIDGAVSLIKTGEREETMVFLEPPFRTKQKFAFYVRKGQGHRLRCYEDLTTLKLGTAWKNTFARLDQDERIEKHHGWNLEKQFSRLEKGQLAALALVEWQGDFHLQNAPDAGLFEKAPYFQKEYHRIYLVMSKKSPHLDKRERLEKALAEMVADESVKAIADRYVPGWYESYRKPFSIAYLSASYEAPSIRPRQVEWIKANQDRKNIAFVVHGGDLVHDGTDDQWRDAAACIGELDGIVPYAIATGNHDVYPGKGIPRLRNTTCFDRHFPLQRRQRNPYYTGHFKDGPENIAYEFQQGSTRLLALVLEFGARDNALDWAHKVLQQHSGWPTVVITHAYTKGPNVRNNHSWRPNVLDRSLNDRDEIWNKLVRKHPSIVLVLSGHYQGVRRESSLGDHGNKVHQIMSGFPEKDELKHGWLRLITFYPEQNKVCFETHSPTLGDRKTDSENQFEVECNLTMP